MSSKVDWMRRRWWAAGAAMVLAAVALTASAGAATKEPYRFQVSAHMTGAGSDFYAPRVEGLRVFFDDLNARGGVNGRPVRMTINDNRGDATVATTQAQSFVDDSSTLFNILASSSATIAPFASVTTPKSMPSFYLGPCYPPAAGPGGAPNWFCLGPNPITDGYTELGIYFGLLKKYGIRQAAPAYVSSNAPGNQAIFTRFIRPIAEQRGAKTGGYLTALPFDQTDFGSTARAIIDSGANSVISYSIPSQQNGVAQALVSAGFKGPIFVIGNAPTTHAALMRIKDPDVYSVEWNAPFSENLKLHKTIQDAAKRRNASFPADDLANGWMLGMMIEAGLKKCGGTCTRESFLAGLNGGVRLSDPAVLGMWGPSKVEWTSTVHTTAYKSYVLVHYDAKQKNVVRVGKWIRQMERPFAFPR